MRLTGAGGQDSKAVFGVHLRKRGTWVDRGIGGINSILEVEQLAAWIDGEKRDTTEVSKHTDRTGYATPL